MVAWLLLYVTIWHVVPGGSRHALRVPYDEDTNVLDTSNIEMLIPLVFDKQTEKPRVAPPALAYQHYLLDERNYEPFSRIPKEAFELDELPMYPGEKSGSIKKDLSRYVPATNMPISMYLHELNDINSRAKGEAVNEAVQDSSSGVMLYICDELLDAFRHRNRGENPMKLLSECRECCSHKHAVMQEGRAAGEGSEWRGGGGEGRGSVSLFAPVGGRRDWMVVHEKYPGLMKNYINTGRKPMHKPF